MKLIQHIEPMKIISMKRMVFDIPIMLWIYKVCSELIFTLSWIYSLIYYRKGDTELFSEFSNEHHDFPISPVKYGVDLFAKCSIESFSKIKLFYDVNFKIESNNYKNLLDINKHLLDHKIKIVFINIP